MPPTNPPTNPPADAPAEARASGIVMKSRLRRQVRGVLNEMAHPVPDLTGLVADFLAKRAHLRSLALFSPMRCEPGLLALRAALPHLTLCFPRVVDDTRIVFHEVQDHGEMQAGVFGILEPLADAPVIAPGAIDVFVCPGLAFDRHGGRLGRGRGYYDRLLANARPDALKIGVCFSCQLVDSVFAERHDIRMDVVISEHGLEFPPP